MVSSLITRLLRNSLSPQRKRAWSTIQGFESLRMLNKGQFDFWLRNDERQTLRGRDPLSLIVSSILTLFSRNNESIVGLIYLL